MHKHSRKKGTILKYASLFLALVVGLVGGCTRQQAAIVYKPSHLRLLVSENGGLRLVDLDSGSRLTLVEMSEANGDFWSTMHVRGGVVVQGQGSGSGAHPIEANAWFVPNEIEPKARLLGKATWVLDDPSGGVWLVDIPRGEGGIGAGTVSLVSLSGRSIKKGSIICCQRPVASLGGGRFVTETTDDEGRNVVHLYDAFSKRFIKRLSSIEIDVADFVRVEGGAVVWADRECSAHCVEHVVDVATGITHLRPKMEGVGSPDSAHVAVKIGSDEIKSISVDGKRIAGSESYTDFGLEWSPDSRSLLFVRPDRKHFGLWELGSRSAYTVRGAFGYLQSWTIFDRAFSRS